MAHIPQVHVNVIFYPMPDTLLAWITSGMGKYSDVTLRIDEDNLNIGLCTEKSSAYMEEDHQRNASYYREQFKCDTVSILVTRTQAERIKEYVRDLIGRNVRYSCMRTTFGIDPYLWFCCFCPGSGGTSLTSTEIIANALLWATVITEGQCPSPRDLSVTDLYSIFTQSV